MILPSIAGSTISIICTQVPFAITISNGCHAVFIFLRFLCVTLFLGIVGIINERVFFGKLVLFTIGCKKSKSNKLQELGLKRYPSRHEHSKYLILTFKDLLRVIMIDKGCFQCQVPWRVQTVSFILRGFCSCLTYRQQI